MKSFVLCLTSFVLAAAASAQGLLRPGANRSAGGIRPSSAAAQRSNTPPNSTPVQSGGRSIEFTAAPLDMVFEVYQNLVGKTVLKDPQVKSEPITLKPQKGQELSPDDKIEAIETVLEMNGVHLEPYGEKFVRALQRKSVRKEGIPLYLDKESLDADVRAKKVADGKVISFMIRFQHISEEDMEKVALKVLESFKSDSSGAPVVLSSGRRVLVTDTYLNVRRMLEIVSEIDVEQPVEPLPEVECIQIHNASASDIVPVIEKIVADSLKEQEEQQKKGGAAAGAVPPPVTSHTPFSALRRPPGQASAASASTSASALVVNASDAAHGIIKGRVTVIAEPKSNKIILITKSENMQMFKRIIEALDVKTTPETDVRVYRLKYADAEDVSDMFNDLIGNSASSKDSKGNQNQNARSGTNVNLSRNTQSAPKPAANTKTSEPAAGELNKENTTVLADKRINGLVVMSTRELFPTIESIIDSMDIKLSQVLIETVIIEVGLGDGIETGMDWVQHGRQRVKADMTNPMGQQMAYRKRVYTKEGDAESSSETVYSDLVPVGYKRTGQITDDDDNVVGTWVDTASEYIAKTTKLSTDGILNYYSGGTATAIGGGQGGEMAYAIAKGVTSNIFGKALNFVFTSDELGLSAILQATKTDSRSKYIASPIIMTLDNKEAVVNATAMHYLLKGFTSSGNSYSTIAVPDYEQKELGIEIKVTPKINPNGTVMLTVEEKYTQLGANEPIQYSTGTGGDGGLKTVGVPTTITRQMSSDVILENNQTVVFGGLTEKSTSESETGIPFLKDIPFIGKWLFGTVSKTEQRTELLVFMTPYVLNDAQAAQAEALRRKKTMTDASPWDDDGWSRSALADPVSKKELMRRMKDEWAKQDEERKTKLAIEKAKVERAKKLKAMSREEREQWLKIHKEELDEEQQEELEEKMLDDKSQEELKKLAAEIRSKKLGEAEREIESANREFAAENERSRLDAAKKTAAEAGDESAK